MCERIKGFHKIQENISNILLLFSTVGVFVNYMKLRHYDGASTFLMYTLMQMTQEDISVLCCLVVCLLLSYQEHVTSFKSHIKSFTAHAKSFREHTINRIVSNKTIFQVMSALGPSQINKK